MSILTFNYTQVHVNVSTRKSTFTHLCICNTLTYDLMSVGDYELVFISVIINSLLSIVLALGKIAEDENIKEPSLMR